MERERRHRKPASRCSTLGPGRAAGAAATPCSGGSPSAREAKARRQALSGSSNRKPRASAAAGAQFPRAGAFASAAAAAGLLRVQGSPSPKPGGAASVPPCPHPSPSPPQPPSPPPLRFLRRLGPACPPRVLLAGASGGLPGHVLLPSALPPPPPFPAAGSTSSTPRRRRRRRRPDPGALNAGEEGAQALGDPSPRACAPVPREPGSGLGRPPAASFGAFRRERGPPVGVCVCVQWPRLQRGANRGRWAGARARVFVCVFPRRGKWLLLLLLGRRKRMRSVFVPSTSRVLRERLGEMR